MRFKWSIISYIYLWIKSMLKKIALFVFLAEFKLNFFSFITELLICFLL